MTLFCLALFLMGVAWPNVPAPEHVCTCGMHNMRAAFCLGLSPREAAWAGVLSQQANVLTINFSTPLHHLLRAAREYAAVVFFGCEQSQPRKGGAINVWLGREQPQLCEGAAVDVRLGCEQQQFCEGAAVDVWLSCKQLHLCEGAAAAVWLSCKQLHLCEGAAVGVWLGCKQYQLCEGAAVGVRLSCKQLQLCESATWSVVKLQATAVV